MLARFSARQLIRAHGSKSSVPLSAFTYGNSTTSVQSIAVRSFVTRNAVDFHSPQPKKHALSELNMNSQFKEQRRSVLHIPLLGVLTPKLIAALALKKTVVVAILQKYGIKGTFDILRVTNDQLGTQLGGAAYPPAARAAVRAGLDALEASVAKLDSKEQADIVYKWISALDPNLIVESFKKYVSTSPAPETSDSPEDKVDKEEEVRLIKEIGEKYPEVARKYHIVLVQRDEPPPFDTTASEASSSNKV